METEGEMKGKKIWQHMHPEDTQHTRYILVWGPVGSVLSGAKDNPCCPLEYVAVCGGVSVSVVVSVCLKMYQNPLHLFAPVGTKPETNTSQNSASSRTGLSEARTEVKPNCETSLTFIPNIIFAYIYGP